MADTYGFIAYEPKREAQRYRAQLYVDGDRIDQTFTSTKWGARRWIKRRYKRYLKRDEFEEAVEL